MPDWMEIIGVISALVGLLIAIPAIYLSARNLYYRIHHVGTRHGRQGRALTSQAAGVR